MFKNNGCVDRSDISVTLDENHECGDKVGFVNGLRPVPNSKLLKEDIEYANKNWNWFTCHETRKCIHPNSRCDLHPHPDCIYENEDGQIVAEDEEGCFEKYKSKGLVPKSANLECQSAIHNSDSIAIQSIVAKFNGSSE